MKTEPILTSADGRADDHDCQTPAGAARHTDYALSF